jgi:hypothetical protein
VLVALLAYGYSSYRGRSGGAEATFQHALQQSVGDIDPKPLQDVFVEKIKRGKKDESAQTAVYWITHRFFDNGGNIYEIYDYVQSHPELAFLNDAEKLYPSIFAAVKAHQVKNYDAQSLSALLGYYWAIDKNGLGSPALWGIAANKHAEFAYGAMQAIQRDPKHKYTKGEVNQPQIYGHNMEFAQNYVNKMESFIAKNTQTTHTLDDLLTVSMIPDDLLVALNQYGAALENLKASGNVFGSSFTPAELYAFNVKLAETKVPRLYFFTNYLYASSLVVGKDATKESVAEPLRRVVEYATKTKQEEWNKSVFRVINAKTANEVGMYDAVVVRKLASLDSGFRSWLIQSGWTEADFR